MPSVNDFLNLTPVKEKKVINPNPKVKTVNSFLNLTPLPIEEIKPKTTLQQKIGGFEASFAGGFKSEMDVLGDKLTEGIRKIFPNYDASHRLDRHVEEGKQFVERMNKIANEAGTPSFMQKVGEGLGGFTAKLPLYSAGGVITKATKLPEIAGSLLNNPKMFPTIGKYVAPFVENTITNLGTFGLPGAIEGQSPASIARDSTLFSILPTFFRNEKLAQKAMIASGDSLLMAGVAKLDGASNEDAAVAGTIGGIMGFTGMFGERNFKTREEALNRVKEIAKKVIKEEPGSERAKRAEEILSGSLDKILNEEKITSKEEIKPEENIPKSLEPLVQEARKYKTAEEFVKAKATLKHRSITPDIQGFKPNEKGIFFTKDAYGERAFGKGDVHITNAYVDLKNPFIANKENVVKLYEDNYGLLKSDAERLADDFEMGDSTAREQVRSFIKGKHDGMIIPDDWDGGFGTIESVVAFDPSQIKTKSQLTDIWNKANKIKEIPDSVIQSIKSTETIVPKENPEVFTSRVIERMKTEFPDLFSEESQIQRKHNEDQLKQAAELILKDKNKAYKIAMNMGEKSDTLSSATNIVMAEKALSEGNLKLFEQLTRTRSFAQTRRGQEIQIEKASVTDNSTARYLKELLKVKLSMLGEKYLTGMEKLSFKEDNEAKIKSKIKKGREIMEQETKKLEKEITEKKIKKETALSLLKALTCK